MRQASAQATEMDSEGIIPWAMKDPTSPILTVLNAITKALTKIEIAEIALAAE